MVAQDCRIVSPEEAFIAQILSQTMCYLYENNCNIDNINRIMVEFACSNQALQCTDEQIKKIQVHARENDVFVGNIIKQIKDRFQKIIK